MADLDRLLRSDVAGIAAEQAHAPDFETIEHRGVQRRRRHTSLVAAALAAALVVAVLALGQVLPGRPDAAPTYPVDRSTDHPTGPWNPIRAPKEVVEERAAQWLDPSDAENGAVDIRRVLLSEVGGYQTQDDFTIELEDPYPDKSRLVALGHVIEYGVVIDTDGNLTPDCHIVASNENATTAMPADLHVWLENLRTGRAVDSMGGPYGYPFDFAHPGEDAPEEGQPPFMRFFFLTGTPAPCDDYGPGDHFYVYSSLTENGQVTSWDFAPDGGWLGFR